MLVKATSYLEEWLFVLGQGQHEQGYTLTTCKVRVKIQDSRFYTAVIDTTTWRWNEIIWKEHDSTLNPCHAILFYCFILTSMAVTQVMSRVMPLVHVVYFWRLDGWISGSELRTTYDIFFPVHGWGWVGFFWPGLWIRWGALLPEISALANCTLNSMRPRNFSGCDSIVWWQRLFFQSWLPDRTSWWLMMMTHDSWPLMVMDGPQANW